MHVQDNQTEACWQQVKPDIGVTSLLQMYCGFVCTQMLQRTDGHHAADLLDAHISCGQLCKAEEADKVVPGQARDVQTSLEVLHDCLHDYVEAACLQQLVKVLPQLPQQLCLQLRWGPCFNLPCMPSMSQLVPIVFQEHGSTELDWQLVSVRLQLLHRLVYCVLLQGNKQDMMCPQAVCLYVIPMAELNYCLNRK